MSTSPDGGIYVNPDPITVTWVGHRDVRAVERLLGSSGGAWAPLHALGDFTLVAVRVRNDGKAASDPQLDAIQVASDDAPPALSAAQRRFYHPMWPLAALATLPLSDECAVHLDPGQSAEVVLVYPPLRRTATILWGVYADFDTYLPAEGGAVPEGLGDLHPHACTAPTPPGA